MPEDKIDKVSVLCIPNIQSSIKIMDLEISHDVFTDVRLITGFPAA